MPKVAHPVGTVDNPWKGDGAAEAALRQAKEALIKLRNEILGILGLAREPLREIAGNTNMHVLQIRLDEALAALSAPTSEEKK